MTHIAIQEKLDGKRLSNDWNTSAMSSTGNRKAARRISSGIVLILGIVVSLGAQPRHISPFTGTWKLNLAKSKFNPGPPFKSFTITFTSDGTRNLELLGADGRPVRISLPWSDGKEVHPKGMENATVISKIEGSTFHEIWKQDGKIIEDVRGSVSSDRKTLTTTVDAMYQQGHHIHNRLTFDKQ